MLRWRDVFWPPRVLTYHALTVDLAVAVDQRWHLVVERSTMDGW